jgi:hypothetical protein
MADVVRPPFGGRRLTLLPAEKHRARVYPGP